MSHVDAGGLRVHYSLAGPEHAPVLMLAHSLGTGLAMWEPQMVSFERWFRVLRYDTRGHGETAVTPGPYNIEQLGRDAVALLDVLEIGRAHVCGISMGGLVGMWLGIHRPERIDRLVLSNTLGAIGRRDSWDERISDALDGNGGMARIASTVSESSFTRGFGRDRPAAVSSIRSMIAKTEPHGYAACCAALRDADQRDCLSQITAPTLVIGGRHDDTTPASDSRWTADQIVDSRYLELEASHLSNIEAAVSFTPAVLEFLDGAQNG
ncbi:3-oxoadipate enol-lactonase [soil metagenome]